jgi:hypothetical protein
MKYYRIIDADNEHHYIEHKTELSDNRAREHGIEHGLLTPLDAHEAQVEEISEDEYELNCL